MYIYNIGTKIMSITLEVLVKGFPTRVPQELTDRYFDPNVVRNPEEYQKVEDDIENFRKTEEAKLTEEEMDRRYQNMKNILNDLAEHIKIHGLGIEPLSKTPEKKELIESLRSRLKHTYI